MAMESKSGVMKVKFDSSAHGKKIESSSSRDSPTWKHKSASSVAKTEVLVQLVAIWIRGFCRIRLALKVGVGTEWGIPVGAGLQMKCVFDLCSD